MDPLDRQLADAVNVDPSPEFVARVRARVASELAPTRVPRWPLVIAAGLAAALAVAVYVKRPDGERAASGVEAVARVPAASTVLESAGEQRVEQQQASASPHRERSIPQVIVAADEARGWRALDDIVRRGDAVFTFDEGAPLQLDVPRVTEVIIVPIEIAPIELASSTTTEGEGQ
jgi:hypothetical protein